MLVCDYIVEFLVQKGITDIFGYPGGMVTYLMDSLSKKPDQINTHTNYHEQACAFAACGYAQSKGIPGVAFATSGPGATNLITGIANAYFDSIPTIFITGQVNTYESNDGYSMRQRGFQETDIISMCKPITKYCVKIIDANQIAYELEKAFFYAMDNRKGPVLLDIPMNIQRTEINVDELCHFKFESHNEYDYSTIVNLISNKLVDSRRAIFILGNGIDRDKDIKAKLQYIISKLQLPVITSMIARDVIDSDYKYNMGFVGAYGHRTANFAVMKSDLVIALGTRLDLRQVSAARDKFAPEATIIRVDIDKSELEYRLHDNDININCDVNLLIEYLFKANIDKIDEHNLWRDYCCFLKQELSDYDNVPANYVVKEISKLIPEDCVITTDVGQNQVWVAQSLIVRNKQRVLYSGSNGAMGYSLPAAIGAYYATGKPIICFCGDGGLQMNIQELQFIVTNKLPVKIVVFNNNSLGMIRHFQEMYFNSNYAQTKKETGYTVPDFCKVANAYGLKSIKVYSDGNYKEIEKFLNDNEGSLIEILLSDVTYVFPKLAMGKPMNDQEPLMNRELYNKLSNGI